MSGLVSFGLGTGAATVVAQRRHGEDFGRLAERLGPGVAKPPPGFYFLKNLKK